MVAPTVWVEAAPCALDAHTKFYHKPVGVGALDDPFGKS